MDAGAAAPSAAAGGGSTTGAAADSPPPTTRQNDALSPRSDIRTLISLSDVSGTQSPAISSKTEEMTGLCSGRATNGFQSTDKCIQGLSNSETQNIHLHLSWHHFPFPSGPDSKQNVTFFCTYTSSHHTYEHTIKLGCIFKWIHNMLPQRINKLIKSLKDQEDCMWRNIGIPAVKLNMHQTVDWGGGREKTEMLHWFHLKTLESVDFITACCLFLELRVTLHVLWCCNCVSNGWLD